MLSWQAKRWFAGAVVPCVLFEDEHLLVVNKPAGMNTHAPAPYAGEGLYDWLRHREPRWASLAIIHRLDKETSGVLLFSKTALANRALTAQFAARRVQKRYLLVTDRQPRAPAWPMRSTLVRVGDRYASRRGNGELAETRFQTPNPTDWPELEPALRVLTGRFGQALWLLEAHPVTGRTHQIRVHAAECGLPILGDVLYGGREAHRVFLHAVELRLAHPDSGAELVLRAAPDFAADPSATLRHALIEESETNAWRVIHGAADGAPGLLADRLGGVMLAQSESALSAEQMQRLQTWPSHSLYHKRLNRHVRCVPTDALTPRLVCGAQVGERFEVRENGLRFELSLTEGYSTGIFLDQRDNRRRLLTGHVGGDFDLPTRGGSGTEPPAVLNLFAYTCGFSVCAAKAGARVTSVDLSRKYLEWGKKNFALNALLPDCHDFLYGDAFDWLKRLARKRRFFDLILLDPPTFAASKTGGVFQAERDYGRLVQASLPLLKPGGVLFASTNAAGWPPAAFVDQVQTVVRAAHRGIEQERYLPQPPDFPISREEPAFLKTVWMRVV